MTEVFNSEHDKHLRGKIVGVQVVAVAGKMCNENYKQPGQTTTSSDNNFLLSAKNECYFLITIVSYTVFPLKNIACT